MATLYKTDGTVMEITADGRGECLNSKPCKRQWGDGSK